ncbi:MAG: FkbM family methyltransferase [Candidatus Bathyarchaeia archaeon]
MRIAARTALQRCVTYPVLSPIMIAYGLTKNHRLLDHMYSIRSIPHGVVLKHGLRMAKYDGKTMFFPSREDPNFDDVFLRDVYHPYKPQARDVVFDVGAHMGFFTLRVARHVARVLAFEPDPYNYAFLSLNIGYNKATNVKTINCALGEKDGSLFLNNYYGHGRTRVSGTKTGSETAVRRIDSVVENEKTVPSVIKIDTEGYELKVLEGAKQTLATHKPRLIIASYHYPTELKEVAEFLRSMDYLCLVYRIPYALQTSREAYVIAEPLHG